MKDFRSRKKNKKNVFYTPVFLVIIFVVLILFVRSAYSSHQTKKKADLEYQKIADEYTELVNKKKDLENKIHNLRTEQGIIEEHKKRFNVAEKGEHIIHIVESRD
ncbi:MAG: septum formation initiator family protein [Minisyncoccia bacterium]